MKTPSTKAFLLLVLSLLLTSLSSCGTMRGFGSDVSRAGHEIQHAGHR